MNDKIIYQTKGDDEDCGENKSPFVISPRDPEIFCVFFEKISDNKPGEKEKQKEVYQKNFPVHLGRKKKTNRDCQQGAKADQKFAVMFLHEG